MLLANPLYTKPELQYGNSYFMKTISNYLFYVNFYVSNYYILENSGLLYTPYINSIYTATDSENGNSVVFNMNKYE